VVDEQPNYGFGEVEDYAVVDQVGNVMGPETGVVVKEAIIPVSEQAKDMANKGLLGTSNGVYKIPHANGNVSDVVGALGHRAGINDLLSRPVNITAKQVLTVAKMVGGKPRGVFVVQNQVTITNNAVNISRVSKTKFY
jgi:hypothetical protein